MFAKSSNQQTRCTQMCINLMYAESSVTILLDYFSIFGHLHHWKSAQWHTQFVKMCFKVCQIQIKLFKNTENFLDWRNFAIYGHTGCIQCMQVHLTSSNPSLHLVIFDILKKQFNCTTYKCLKWCLRMQRWDSNSRPREHASPPITTRSENGLVQTEARNRLSRASKKYFFLLQNFCLISKRFI